MRFASAALQGPTGPVPRLVAVLDNESLVDVTAAGELWWALQGCADAAAWAAVTFPPHLLGLLRGGERALEMAAEAVELAIREGAEVVPSGARVQPPASELTSLPLLRPPLIRDFYSFEGHVAAGAARRGEAIPEPWFRRPFYYKANPATILPPGAEVPWPAYTDALDYELEVACVVKAAGPDLTPEGAEKAIAGYCLYCDFSARDIQREEMALRLGPAKGKDFATGLGPWLVTPDELGNPADLLVTAQVNGEEVARGRLGDSRWSLAEMVAYASAGEPLQAGEVFASGTVSGGSGQERGRLLEPGDWVECLGEGLGRLSHRVGERHRGGGASGPPVVPAR